MRPALPIAGVLALASLGALAYAARDRTTLVAAAPQPRPEPPHLATPASRSGAATPNLTTASSAKPSPVGSSVATSAGASPVLAALGAQTTDPAEHTRLIVTALRQSGNADPSWATDGLQALRALTSTVSVQ